MKRRHFLTALVLVACARGDRPIDPVWGKQACAGCGMLVENRRTAAEVTKDGEHYFFDDPGCMVLWLEAHAGESRAWAKDAESGAWLDAKDARWSAGATTPMDFGWEASTTRGQPWSAMRTAVLDRQRSER